MSLTTVCSEIYVPAFDSNKDMYYDESPYVSRERNCIHYECRCKAGAYFTNNSSFKQHVKSKTHKDFIQNYKKYYKEVDEASQTINDLKAELEILKRKYAKLLSQNKKLLEIIQENNDDEMFSDCL